MSRFRGLLALALLVAIAGVTASPAQAAITSRGLLFRLDSKNPASYPGSGTAWKDLSGNGYDVTLVNGANTTCSVAYAGSETCASGTAETVTTGVRMPTMQFYNQTAATTTATCNWKPSQHGTITLSAQFLPSNNTLTAQTKETLVTVNARSGNR
jgi:hypothetical protein